MVRLQPVSAGWLQREQAAIRRQRNTIPLMDFIPTVTPRWTRPDPLRPYLDVLEQAPNGGLRVVVAAPPQHGKTTSTLHAMAKWVREHPHLRHVYATYADERAGRVAFEAESIFRRAGLCWKARKGFWRFSGGGSILWTALTGQITGQPIDGVFIIDDPYKDRKQANSAAYRQDTIDRLDDVAETRVHPGASIIVMATRWHPQDLSGLLRKRAWPYINLKAIADGKDQPQGDTRGRGEALWPARKSLEELKRLRSVNAYSFASLFQGEPIPRGGNLFAEPHYYDTLPQHAYRVGYGLDLAYTQKTSADWSVLLRLFRYGTVYYVRGVWRAQVKAPAFAQVIRAKQSEHRGPAYWYCAGTEHGSADFMRVRGVNLQTLNADSDKFTRAQGCADAWNSGRILWPSFGGEPEPDWSVVALDEIQNFTGVNDDHDDIVDALVSGFDGLERYGSGDYDESYDRCLPGLRA